MYLYYIYICVYKYMYVYKYIYDLATMSITQAPVYYTSQLKISNMYLPFHIFWWVVHLSKMFPTFYRPDESVMWIEVLWSEPHFSSSLKPHFTNSLFRPWWFRTGYFPVLSSVVWASLKSKDANNHTSVLLTCILQCLCLKFELLYTSLPLHLRGKCTKRTY